MRFRVRVKGLVLGPMGPGHPVAVYLEASLAVDSEHRIVSTCIILSNMC